MKKNHKVLTITLLGNIINMFTAKAIFATKISDIDSPATDEFKSFGITIVSVLSTIGIVISVIMLAALGIKYMVGSVEQRAEYKKSLMPYFIGAGLVFGASTIAQIVYLFVK